MKLQREFFGWFDLRRNTYMVSRYPADAPVRPSIPFETLSEVNQMLLQRKATIMWWPPLTLEQETIS